MMRNGFLPILDLAQFAAKINNHQPGCVTPEVLAELVKYIPETGDFFWRPRDRKWFGCDRSFNSWNNRFSGASAFYTSDGGGYLRGYVFGRCIKAHRAAWALSRGHWPSGVIDHINGDGLDNRLVNLRDVTLAENNKNIRSFSGREFGVRWSPQNKKWRAEISIDGRTKHIGYFLEENAAIAARKIAEAKYGFHENHGGQA